MPLVTVSRVVFVCSLLSVTVTPGMTPCGSLTTPRRPPCADCACAKLAVTAKRKTARLAWQQPERTLRICPSCVVRSVDAERRRCGCLYITPLCHSGHNSFYQLLWRD